MTDDQIKECIDSIDFSQMVTADDLFYMIARAVLSASGQASQSEKAVRDALIGMSNALKEIDHITQAAHEGGYGAEGNLKALRSITRFAQTWLTHSDVARALSSTPAQQTEAQQSADKWKQMAEYQYALRQYPNELELGQGALDDYFKTWTWDSAIAKEKAKS